MSETDEADGAEGASSPRKDLSIRRGKSENVQKITRREKIRRRERKTI